MSMFMPLSCVWVHKVDCWSHLLEENSHYHYCEHDEMTLKWVILTQILDS